MPDTELLSALRELIDHAVRDSDDYSIRVMANRCIALAEKGCTEAHEATEAQLQSASVEYTNIHTFGYTDWFQRIYRAMERARVCGSSEAGSVASVPTTVRILDTIELIRRVDWFALDEDFIDDHDWHSIVVNLAQALHTRDLTLDEIVAIATDARVGGKRGEGGT